MSSKDFRFMTLALLIGFIVVMALGLYDDRHRETKADHNTARITERDVVRFCDRDIRLHASQKDIYFDCVEMGGYEFKKKGVTANDDPMFEKELPK